MKRMPRVAILSLVYCCTSLVSFSQPTGDTTQVLQEVVISTATPAGGRPLRTFSAGTGTLKYTEQQLKVVRQQSLSEFLQTNSAIYFKEYGKGMSSTMALRGTSASQTSVQWNGINLNMPTMGTMDFSHLPLFFIDAVEVHAGGESAVYGNGTIGGSVQLHSSAKYEPGLHFELQQHIGSFGYLFTGGTLRVAGARWENRTSAMYNTCDNNYEFTDITVYGHPRRQLNNAGTRNYGVLEELYFRPSKQHELSARVWHNDFRRQLQPLMSKNEIPQSYDSLYDRNTRAIVAYAGEIASLKIEAQAGYASDYELFRTDTIAVDKFIGAAGGEYNWKQLIVKIGGNVEYIKPNVYAYAAGTKEWRSDIYMNARWNPLPRWAISAGLRQYFVTNVEVPLAPSAGLSYQALQSAGHHLKIRAAASYNIKIPSLNDLYWGGTVATLRPEKGWNSEIGTDYAAYTPAWTFKVNGTAYFNRISDWIRWLPVGVIWRPRNIGIVDAYGAELGASALYSTAGKVSMEIYGNYAYTAVILRESNTKNDPNTDIQVAYQPEHCANLSVKINYDKLFLKTAARYTGQRHTEDQFDIMPAYLLTDITTGYSFTLYKFKLLLSAQCNNVFNIDYQNIKYFAMPGRSFNFNLTIQF